MGHSNLVLKILGRRYGNKEREGGTERRREGGREGGKE